MAEQPRPEHPHVGRFRKAGEHLTHAKDTPHRARREALRVIKYGFAADALGALAVASEIFLQSKGIQVGNLTTNLGEVATGVIWASTVAAGTSAAMLGIAVKEIISGVLHLGDAGAHAFGGVMSIMDDPQGAAQHYVDEAKGTVTGVLTDVQNGVAPREQKKDKK